MSTASKHATITILASLTAISKMLLIPAISLVLCNIIDYATALIAIKINGGKFDSNTGIKGIYKKVLMWLLVVVGVIFDGVLKYAAEAIGFEFKIDFLIGCIVCVWLVFNEMISILENIKACGIKLPPFLEPLIKTAQEQIEDKANNGK